MNKIEDTYRKMTRRINWMHLPIDTPIAIIFHGQKHLTEEQESVDDWVLKSEPTYPTKPSFFFHDPFHMMHRTLHDNWIKEQENKELNQHHVNNLTSDDRIHIGHLVVGGMMFGHDSGSKDINDYLFRSHQKMEYPNTFIRTKHPGLSANIPDKHIDLTKIDSAIGKNDFGDSQFHTLHGLNFDPRNSIKDDVLHLPAYTSGSLNRAIALKYSAMSPVDGTHHILHIVHPSYSKGIYVGNPSNLNDNEVLLPRNMTLKMPHKEPTTYDVSGKRVNVWLAHRMSHLENT